MTMDQLRALPVGALVKIHHDDEDGWEIGEIIESTPLQVTVIWPGSGITQYIGGNAWKDFVAWLEIEE